MQNFRKTVKIDAAVAHIQTAISATEQKKRAVRVHVS